MGDRGTWQPKSNSMSSHEEKLAEYRETVLNNEALARIDRRKDPGIFWKPLPYDPRFPNINITGYVCRFVHEFFLASFFKFEKFSDPILKYFDEFSLIT